jgi:tRNA pseudouridine55 synthase
MQGLLKLDKPVDWTSFDVVNYVRNIVANCEDKKPKNIKVGHTGTLDPFATGLLLILVGKEYTRRASELSKLNKVYDLTLRLGKISSTGDTEGELNPVSGLQPKIDELTAAIAKFTGQIEQIPPIYSAIKINGQRAYKLARSGQEVVMPPRQVFIHKLELISYNYPDANLKAEVSSGTYIRSLVEDIGKQLGVGAYTLSLRRTKIGQYNLSQAVAPKALTESVLEHSLQAFE